MKESKESKILRDLIENTNLRLTKPRRLIFEELAKLNRHVDAEEFLQCLSQKGHKISRATVYRNLEFLVDKGLVRKSDFGESHFHYEIRGAHHDHMICTNCNKITEFFCESLELEQQKVAQDYHFTITSHSMQIFGLCEQCKISENLNISPLTELRVGDRAKVLFIHGDGVLRRRLIEMGMQEGVEIEIVKYAPLKDPLEIILRNYHLSLRVKDAEQIEVELLRDESS